MTVIIGSPANKPIIKRAVVPELPKYKGVLASFNELSPSLFMVTVVPDTSIDTPKDLNASIVCKQSSPSKKLVIVVVPLAMEPNMTARRSEERRVGKECRPR